MLEQRRGCWFKAKRKDLGIKRKVMPCDIDAAESGVGDHESECFLMDAYTDENARGAR